MGGERNGKQEPQEEPQGQVDQASGQQEAPQEVGSIDWERQIAERDECIAALEAQVAEAAKNAETAEQLRGEIAELKQASADERIDFKLQLAGVRNVKAARALLSDHENDVDKLKEAEPWLFEATGRHAAKGSGTTGLPNAGAASDDGKTLKHWREIAGISDDDKRQE